MRSTPIRSAPRRRHWHFLAFISAFSVGLVLVGLSGKVEATRTTSAAPVGAQGNLITESLAVPSTVPPAETEQMVPEVAVPQIEWQKVVVQQGDTLSGIFDRQGLGFSQLSAILAADGDAGALQRLRPGQELLFDIRDGQLNGLKYCITKTKTLVIGTTPEGYVAHSKELPIEIRTSHASAEIQNSLFEAGQRAGLSDNLIMELAGIFGWDIDFALDIREGDTFSVLYEERYLDGEKLGDGAIIAAEFVNQGRVFQAVRYSNPEGDTNYYTPAGLSMRKAFLRSPVDFRRISSGFQRERYHPVLGKKRPHRGVDYAAAIGTPIKAAGDGKVIFRGTKGGYGNTIILQHGAKNSTLYAHLSKFGSGLKAGSRVRQGQTIGYVGKTGMATGPHLHYEFRINGVHRNPLTVKLPNAAPIPEQYKEDFLAKASELIAQLELIKGTKVALGQ